MSVLAGLFHQLESTPTPCFEQIENMAFMVESAISAANDEHQGQAITCHGLGVEENTTDDQAHGFVITAATAAPEWLAARDGYVGHLMSCRACHAPVSRYCSAGAKLREAYEATPWI